MKHRDILLALGGGGARGLAHIGIIRVLEEAGYRIRGVAGTSIGAVIGGTWCAGRLHLYEEFLEGLRMPGVLRLIDPRLPVRGLVGGRKIERLLRRLTDSRQVEDTEVPFVAVATELTEGTEVRLRSGDLALAMRASYAIPGFFTPVLLDKRWLVDGGVSTPVPVRAAAELGEFPVVAVNVNSSGQPPVEAAFHAITGGRRDQRPVVEPKILRALSDSIAHLQFNLASYQLRAHPPACVIEPQLRGIGLFDFHRAKQLIEVGRETMRTALHSGDFELALNRAQEASKADLPPRIGGWLRGKS